MILDNFIKKYNGKSVDYDGMYGGQCQDLALFWEVENDWPTIRGNAIDTPNTFDKSFYDWIPNTATGVPNPGDLVIWGMKPYGHIAIFVSGTTYIFTSFDQNWPVGSPCKLTSHNYNNVIGWIHPKPKGESMELFNKNAYSLGVTGKRYFHLTYEEATALKAVPLQEFKLYSDDWLIKDGNVYQHVESPGALNEITGNKTPKYEVVVFKEDYDSLDKQLKDCQANQGQAVESWLTRVLAKIKEWLSKQ